MDSSLTPKDEIWFLRVRHHISNAVYQLTQINSTQHNPRGEAHCRREIPSHMKPGISVSWVQKSSIWRTQLGEWLLTHWISPAASVQLDILQASPLPPPVKGKVHPTTGHEGPEGV